MMNEIVLSKQFASLMRRAAEILTVPVEFAPGDLTDVDDEAERLAFERYEAVRPWLEAAIRDPRIGSGHFKIAYATACRINLAGSYHGSLRDLAAAAGTSETAARSALLRLAETGFGHFTRRKGSEITFRLCKTLPKRPVRAAAVTA